MSIRFGFAGFELGLVELFCLLIVLEDENRYKTLKFFVGIDENIELLHLRRVQDKISNDKATRCTIKFRQERIRKFILSIA